MSSYPWAANALKLARAVGKGGDEESIKAYYVSIGGLLTSEYQTNPEVVEEPTVVLIGSEVVELPEEQIIETKVKRAVKAVKKVTK